MGRRIVQVVAVAWFLFWMIHLIVNSFPIGY